MQGRHRACWTRYPRHARDDQMRISVHSGTFDIAKRLAQLVGVNLGQPNLDLLFPSKDGQGVAVLDGYDEVLGGGACPCR